MIDEMRDRHETDDFTKTPDEVEKIYFADLTLRADPETYKEELHRLQREIAEIPQRLKAMNKALILVFEGWDAAGKSGAIRRFTDAVREDRVQVFSTSAPSAEEASRHYLWRFWRTVPSMGSVAIYDRSWYGRVLVERVEGFTGRKEWEAAYGEINDFERTLAANGYILRKFWLEISPGEQLRRFEARLRTPEKRSKITPEDWRNRRHRDAYLPALADMLSLTDTPHAPWNIVPAEDKKYARLHVLRQILSALDD